MKEYIFKQYLANIIDHMNISLEDLLEETKTRTIVEARYILYYLCQERGMSLSEIKSYMETQGFEVTIATMMKGVAKAKDIIDNDSDYKHIVKKLQEIELWKLNAICLRQTKFLVAICRTHMKEYIFRQYLANILSHLDITQNEFFEQSKKREVVLPRQILYYLCREKANMQFTEIRRYLSKQGFEVALDTIIYGYNSFSELLKEDEDYLYIVNKLKEIQN